MLLGKTSSQNQLMNFIKKPPTFFIFFNFTSDVHNKNHQLPPNSQWIITTALPRIDHIQRYEKNTTHDDYQLSTKPLQRKSLEIIKTTVSWKLFNNRIEGEFEEESLFEDIVCFVLYLIVGVIYVSFRIQSGGTMFLGGFYIIAYFYMF